MRASRALAVVLLLTSCGGIAAEPTATIAPTTATQVPITIIVEVSAPTTIPPTTTTTVAPTTTTTTTQPRPTTTTTTRPWPTTTRFAAPTTSTPIPTTTAPTRFYGFWEYAQTTVNGGRTEGGKLEAWDSDGAHWRPILWVFCDIDDATREPGVLVSIPWQASWSPAYVGYSLGEEAMIEDWWEVSDGTVWPSDDFISRFLATDKDVLFVVFGIDTPAGATFALEGLDQIRDRMGCWEG